MIFNGVNCKVYTEVLTPSGKVYEDVQGYIDIEELGVYTMTVQIDELGVNDAVEIGNMTKNYSMYAIIAFSALGFVLLVIAIITTIRKVKKERVW